MTEIGTLLQNRYLIEQKIGNGGMGAVYLGTDQKFDNPVAIKETFYKEDEFAEAFEREAKLLNGLQHPVLPHVSDYFADGNNYFIVMQFIEGEDLSDVLKRDGAFPIADVVRWTEVLLDALDYLHSHNPPVIHRDIKPHNLKLTPRGDIMLLDFGLAKLNEKDATEISVFGYSRTYSPLEQIQGTGTDARSDIFALGATVYHLLTGKAPVNALTRAGAIVNGKTDQLMMANELRPEIPESLAAVIQTALALNAQNRFETAQAMSQALKHAARELKDSATTKNFDGIAKMNSNAPKDDKFAALESFAAAQSDLQNRSTAENSPTSSPLSTKIDQASSQPLIVDLGKSSVSNEPANSQNRFFIAAAAAILLFFGIGAAFYFGGGSAHEAEATNAPAKPTAPLVETASEKPEKISTTQKSDEKTSIEKSKNEPANPTRAASKSADQQTSEKQETVALEERSVEFADEEPVDEAPKVKTRQKPDGIPDEMTEEEFQKIKREEKQKRRERRAPSKTPDEPENENTSFN